MICQNVKINIQDTGFKIKSLIKEKRVSIITVAKCLSVSRQTVYKWISGQSLPSLDNLVQLSVLLETSIDEIIVIKRENDYVASDYYVRDPLFISEPLIIR